jgi:hypothetical protein
MTKKINQGLHLVVVLSILIWGSGLANLTPINSNLNIAKAV